MSPNGDWTELDKHRVENGLWGGQASEGVRTGRRAASCLNTTRRMSLGASAVAVIRRTEVRRIAEAVEGPALVIGLADRGGEPRS